MRRCFSPHCVLTVASRAHDGPHGWASAKENLNPVLILHKARLCCKLWLCEFGCMFSKINSKMIFTLKTVCLSFVLAWSFTLSMKSGVQLRLQSRFSGTQKPITRAEPISYLELKPLFTEQVQLQYFVQFMDCVTVRVHEWRRESSRDLQTMLYECYIDWDIILHTYPLFCHPSKVHKSTTVESERGDGGHRS